PVHLHRALVPNLILQPLVENALRHGLGGQDGAGRISISAVSEGDALRLEVFNDGAALPRGWSLERAAGVGLSNTRARLLHLYGSAASLSLVNETPTGVVATVLIPFRLPPSSLSHNGDNGH
ncbi:MAG TPA: ATP-binding protein, partial [Gemmatimonadales bacterium]|nr:ATP-binding protein [Gemmatimonadales bacterium]